MENGTQEKDSAQWTETAPRSASKRKRVSQRLQPTSVALTESEIRAADDLAASRHISRAALFREAIRQHIANHGVAAIATGLQPYAEMNPRVAKALVELANHMVALSYAVRSLESQITRRKRAHVRMLLNDTLQSLEQITGVARC